MRLPKGIEIWFAHLWQTILHLQPFTGNGLPWWDCRFSRLGQLCQELYCSCLQTSHTQINGLSWLLSCIVLFMFGFLCRWVVSNMSLCQRSILEDVMMFFIFCGWKLKSKPRIVRQENLEDLCLTQNHGSFPPDFFFVSIHRTTSTILGMFTTDIDPQPSQYPSSSDPRNAIARTTGRKLHAQNMHLVAGDGIWH